jgi:hypothetical protein
VKIFKKSFITHSLESGTGKLPVKFHGIVVFVIITIMIVDITLMIILNVGNRETLFCGAGD